MKALGDVEIDPLWLIVTGFSWIDVTTVVECEIENGGKAGKIGMIPLDITGSIAGVMASRLKMKNKMKFLVSSIVLVCFHGKDSTEFSVFWLAVKQIDLFINKTR